MIGLKESANAAGILGRLLGTAAVLCVPLSVNAQDAGDEPFDLGTLVLSASRSEQVISEIPRSVTVIDSEEITEIISRGQDIHDVLSQNVPGMGTSIQGNLSSKGQNNIRGRRVLLLINGVSQNNSFLDFGQEFNAINPYNIERIEVIRGGTAIYGLGAQGGVINVITKTPEPGETRYRTEAGISFQDDSSDTITYRFNQQLEGGTERTQWRLGLGYESRGGNFDGNGVRLPSFSTADDMDSMTLDAAINHNIDSNQSLSFNLSHRRIQDNDGWCAEGADAANAITATAFRCGPGVNSNVPGTLDSNGNSPVPNDVVREFANYQLKYQNTAFALGALDVTGYWMTRDTETFTLRLTDRSPTSPTTGQALFGYNETDFDRYGVRVSVDSSLSWADVVWGVDLEQAEFSQPNTFGFVNNTPDVEQTTAAVFAQFTSDLSDKTVLSYGLRYEYVRFSVNDFTVGNTFPNAGNTVQGGNPDFDDVLFNFGIVHDIGENHQIFASFAQGFTTNEALRDIRGGNSDTVEGAIQPINTDNYEIGVRGQFDRSDYSLAAFYSESDLGATLSLSDDGTRLESVRAPERVWGAEATFGYDISPVLRFDGSVSWQEGERRLAEGEPWQPLDGTRIAPVKVTASFKYDAEDWGRYSLDMIYSGSRDEQDEITSGAAFPVDSFLVANLGAEYDVGPGTLNLGIENLFDEDYITPYAQAQRNRNRYYGAPGRRFYVGYTAEF